MNYSYYRSLLHLNRLLLLFSQPCYQAMHANLYGTYCPIFITPLKLLKSEQLSFYQRYLDILEFTKLGKSSTIFNKLKKMYPEDSQFVVLPMDMEYMGAGSTKESYLVQLDELNKLFYSEDSNGRISTTKN